MAPSPHCLQDQPHIDIRGDRTGPRLVVTNMFHLLGINSDDTEITPDSDDAERHSSDRSGPQESRWGRHLGSRGSDAVYERSANIDIATLVPVSGSGSSVACRPLDAEYGPTDGGCALARETWSDGGQQESMHHLQSGQDNRGERSIYNLLPGSVGVSSHPIIRGTYDEPIKSPVPVHNGIQHHIRNGTSDQGAVANRHPGLEEERLDENCDGRLPTRCTDQHIEACESPHVGALSRQWDIPSGIPKCNCHGNCFGGEFTNAESWDLSPGEVETAGENEAWRLMNDAIHGSRRTHGGRVTMRADFLLPLHVKKVGRLVLSKVKEFILDELRVSWDHAYQQLFDYDTLIQRVNSLGNLNKPYEARLSTCDIEVLIERQCVRRCSAEDILAFCRVFSVNETAKQRRRWIVEPLVNWTNDEVTWMSLTTTEETCQFAKHAILHDFPWFYGQFPIPVEVQGFYGFIHMGNYFVCLVAPTGARHMPQLSECLTKSVAHSAARGMSITTNTYIDNVRFSSDNKQMLRIASDRFCALCDTIGITINAESRISPCLSTYDFLGVTCSTDVSGVPSVTITEKTRIKLQRAQESDITEITLREFLAHIGVCVFAAKILGWPLAKAYIIFKFLRRRCREYAVLDICCSPWPVAIIAINNWREEILHMSPRILLPTSSTSPSTHIIAFTDASQTGYGITLFIHQCKQDIMRQRIIFRAGKFTRKEHINILELRTVLYGLRAICEVADPLDCRVDFRVDNTTAIAVAKKGRSRNFFLNKIARDIELFLSANKFASIQITYVKSCDNEADWVSRLHFNFALDEEIRGEDAVQSEQ